MATLVAVITAYLYWRCCCFLSSDCLIREVNIQLNAEACRKSLIWEGGGLLTLRIFQCTIYVEFENYVNKLCRLYEYNIGLFAAAIM